MAETVRLSELIPPAFRDLHRTLRGGFSGEVWLRGGRGSGKSSFASIELWLRLLRDPGAHAVVYRRVAATLRESVFEQLLWAADRLGLRPWLQARLSPPELTLTRGGRRQRVLFRGADDPMRSKSIKVAEGSFRVLWFEELAEFRGMDDLMAIRASVIRGGGGAALVMCSYNPPVSASSWVNEEALRPRPDRIVHDSCYLDMPPEWLGESFLAEAEALRRSNERAWRHMYLGEVTGTGANVFDNLAVRPITAEEIAAFGTTCAGLDWGWYPDPAHFARCAWDPRARRLWVFDEFRAVKMSNRDLWERLTRDRGLTAAEEVIADSAERKSIADMRAYGMRCTAAAKGPGSVRASIRWLQSLREIVIDPVRCPAAAKEFREYEYERDRDGRPADAFPDRDNHAIDAVRYATNRVWRKAGA